MRVCEVMGTVTLSRRIDNLAGGHFILVQPLSSDEIAGGASPESEPLVAYDEMSAGVGCRIALAEGPEAAMPLAPRLIPIDAYCAAILDDVRVAADAEEREATV